MSHPLLAAEPCAPLAPWLSLMDRHARFAKDSVRRAAAEFGPVWEQDVSELLARLYDDEAAQADALKGYAAFVMDSMRRQKRFERDGHYAAKTYAEAAAEVYFNDDHMRRQYLPGLLLSHFLWAHHYRQIEYFRSAFLAPLARAGVREFAEVGVGTGIYSRLALTAWPGARGTGFDISPMSLQFTQDHVARYGGAARYEARLHDILQSPCERRFPAVVCVEVLEHLEDPVAMLRGLAALTAPGGRLFVTAALNAADADHIHLYRQPQDVFDQLRAAGLHLEHAFFAQAYAPAAPDLPVPAALAMVCTTPS